LSPRPSLASRCKPIRQIRYSLAERIRGLFFLSTLADAALRDSSPFAVTSSDGLEIESFFTLPESEDVPLVVMPHGGPFGIADERTYDPTVQFLAFSGWAVLQVNYRGSAGYGRAFLEAGKQQWGTGIEDDIEAAVRHVVAQGWVDPDRVCIFGGSYGGYSALMSAIRYPERYRCAATFAGVTDIPLMFSTSDWASNTVLTAMQRDIIGDPDTQYEALRDLSPVFRVDEIGVPVLVAHGRWDERVDIDHAYRLKMMFDLHGQPLELHVLETGHGFASSELAGAFHEKLLDFLERSVSQRAGSASGPAAAGR
jgi:dipeptidyl aminopeptidase/acylaminoacyl peptidase